MLTTEIFGRVCRVCLRKSKNMHDINETTDEGLTINEMLSKATSALHANIEFPVPKEICELCLENLQISFRFQQLCINTTEQMLKIWEQYQKVEVKKQSIQEEAENEEESDPIKVDDKASDKDELIFPENSLNSDSTLQRYCSKVELTNPFVCYKCTQRFRTKSLMEKHLESCKKGKRKISSKSDNEDNDEDMPLSALKKIEPDNESDVSKGSDNSSSPLNKCLICNEMFATKNMLQNHTKSIHGNSKNTLKIHKHTEKALDKGKGNNADDNSHIDEMDNDNDDSWNEVNQTDSSEDGDSDFIEEKTSTKLKPEPSRYQLACNECDASFRSEFERTRHIKKHREGHRFVCALCWDRFKYPHMLQKHMDKHHPEDNPQTNDVEAKAENVEKTHICSYCSAAYLKLGGLAQHITRKHPEIKPFKCDKCDKTFVVEEHFKVHTNRHMGIKNFKCDLCEKSFSFKYARNHHMRTHTGDFNYECAFCGKKFYRANNLRLHMQRHGDDKL